ncbi:MAG: tRNA (adenosine(37)-N6)-dimethylallyltransferase MiaA [Pseudomonadota bacterium]
MIEAILIAGPTASGKSAIALTLARERGGAVINADSQQVFADWRILTARPTEEEEALAPHFLYGHLPLTEDYSVGHWLRDLEPVLETCRERQLLPIITGGTGLYFKALTEGIAPIPPTPEDIRLRGEAELETLGLTDFAAALQSRDPKTAAVIDLQNPRRVLRAWEVLETTGRGLADWREETEPPLIPLERCDARVVLPDRETLYRRCDARFDRMLADGALEEVRRVRAQNIPLSAPGYKTLGAKELTAHLEGKLDLETATADAKTATRRYAKRQLTWARNQMSTWQIVRPGD